MALTGSPNAVACLYDSACKRSLYICGESRALFPVSRFCLSLYSLYDVLNKDVYIIQLQIKNPTKGVFVECGQFYHQSLSITLVHQITDAYFELTVIHLTNMLHTSCQQTSGENNDFTKSRSVRKGHSVKFPNTQCAIH